MRPLWVKKIQNKIDSRKEFKKGLKIKIDLS
jgi:hypothetical protein